MVYYRKYRPQTVAELDLEEIRGKLELILKAKELPHAFLFTGPKGLGKTSAARILAKAINCEKRKGIEPCNKCDACVSVTNGSNIDVIEIDAASNRGIDEIRDLREKIKFAPANLSKKVYIIDEVHMLTTDAFNALLKTLEEPPSHAVFILCTTEVEKVPGTIASRTFHVQFKKPTRDEVLHSLLRIVKGEKLDIEKEVLDHIFKFSEGSFRDAAKILEELVIGSAGKKITIETLETIYKTSGMEQNINNLLACLAQKNLKKALKLIDELSQKGTDFKILTETIAQKLHDMLIHPPLSGETSILESGEFQTNELRELLSLVNNSYRDIKLSVLPQIPLELVVVEWCLKSVQNSKLKIQNSEEKLHSKDEEKPAEAKSQPPKADSKAGHGMFSENAKSDNFITALIAAVKKDNHSIAGILRGCKLVNISNDTVLFETKYKFHKDRLSDPQTLMILDQCASEILKEKVHVVVNLVEK